MQTPSVSRIFVEGLFDQFNIDLALSPGLNVIYGKNGRGKTTLLHILANILELDFSRFSFLQFRTIHVVMHGGASLTIQRLSGEAGIRVLMNGAHFGNYGHGGSI